MFRKRSRGPPLRRTRVQSVQLQLSGGGAGGYRGGGEGGGGEGLGLRGGGGGVKPEKLKSLKKSLSGLRAQKDQESSIHTLCALKTIGNARLHRTLEWLGPLT